MNRLSRITISTLAALTPLAACGGEAPKVRGGGEVVKCIGPWKTADIGHVAVYTALTDGGILKDMGVPDVRFPGFIALTLEKADPTRIANTLSFPTDCSVEAQLTDGQVVQRLHSATNKETWESIGLDVSPSGADAGIIAPLFNPRGKIEN